jgi:fatty acyl-CoA reductase
VHRTLPDDALQAITDKILEGRPNTYTYTKALAEQAVAKNEGKYPIAIVRPSIVISAAKEPVEGWVDNVNGIAGLGCLAAIGLLRTIDWDYYARSDMVPVDYVANCLICSAYEIAVRSPKKLLVYNMTSGNVNPVSWGVYFEKLRSVAVRKPPTKIVRPMIHSPKYRRANPITFFMTKLFSELLFAYMVDMILVLLGYKKIMLKITKKMHHGYTILLPFTSNEWNFNSENVLKLSDSLDEEDKKKFYFDLRKLDWDEQAEQTWHGGRTYLLKEEPTEESYKWSMGRQRIVTIVHYAGMVIIAASIALVGFTGISLLRA